MRKRYLESTTNAEIDEDKDVDDITSMAQSTDISRKSLEEDARRASLHGADPASRFWMHQRGWTESAKIGAGIIQAQPTKDGVKKQQ